MIELNKVLLTGRLTKDPELKYIASGTGVCEMRIASDRNYFDKAAGEKKKETLFINVSAWGRTAEFCNQYLRKGSAIFVEGRLKLDSWKDKEGNNREKIQIVADSVSFGESKAEADARMGGGGGRSSGPSDEHAGAPASSSGPPPSETRDDLPF